MALVAFTSPYPPDFFGRAGGGSTRSVLQKKLIYSVVRFNGDTILK